MRNTTFCVATTLAAVAAALAAVAGTPALAASTFQQSCSNIAFAYSGNAPAINAECLRANGTPNATSLVLQGIGNNNGNLTQGSGASTFQQSCGNILIVVESPTNVILSAYCRTGSGASNPTTLPLNNIGNNNGVLSQ
jgi:hypothetical protein